jgi:hypothetical protein
MRGVLAVLRAPLFAVRAFGAVLGGIGRAAWAVLGALRSVVSWTIPDDSLLHEPRFRNLLTSRFLADVAQQSLAYGAIVAVVRAGGSALDAAIIGVAALIPPATIGIYAGALSDLFPRRLALGGGYLLQAIACLTFPWLLGTDMLAVVALLLTVHTFGQISGPAEQAIVPHVASRERLAGAASLISFTSSAGGAAGAALVAPVLVALFGVEPVIYVAGVLLLIGCWRVVSIGALAPVDRAVADRAGIGWRAGLRWLALHPQIGMMICLGVLAGTSNSILQTLAPRYVSESLGVDAANAVYIFAPASLGMLLALALSPLLQRLVGARIVGFTGFACVAVSVALLGVASDAGRLIDTVNPLTLLSTVDLEVSRSLRTAGFLTMPIGFGVTLTATAVQSFINRNVPDDYQGRTFALHGALKNILAILPLLSLGAVASVVGIDIVLVILPATLVVLLALLMALSRRYTQAEAVQDRPASRKPAGSTSGADR